ncbi:response regulator transcription factor [Streptomyces syringium]|uniref:response regulator transcription factor n=1 Tax=Streptomyces syringium TaxID=76729 RepID=UPI00342FC4CF
MYVKVEVLETVHSSSSGSPRPLRVLVVDDEPLVRTGLTMILSAAPDIEASNCDGYQAAGEVARSRPDVVLLDIQMPDVDGLAVLRSLRAMATPPRIAMLTVFDATDRVRAALRLGADGYMLKNTEPDQLIRDVRALADGARPLSAHVTPAIIEDFLAADRGGPESRENISRLSPRERQALSLIRLGLTNQEIARKMFLAPSTAKDHVTAVLAKLGGVNRVQAAVMAERARLIPPQPRQAASPQVPAAVRDQGPSAP